MKKIMFILLTSVFLLACTHEKLVYRDRVVEVPKIVFKELPKAAKIKKPEYAIDKATNKSTDDEILNFVMITLEQDRNYIKKLEIALKPFQEKSNAEDIE